MNLITFDVNEALLKKKDKDLLTKKTNFFIGDWCLKQENIYLPNKKKYRTPKYYHWDNHEKFTRDKIYLKKIYLIILKNLSKNLNMYHNTQYPIKYWELLISRWLWTYLGYLLDRWEIINSVLKNNKITSTVAFNFEEKKFIPKNSSNFHNNVMWSNYWSHWVFSEIIKFLGKTKIIFVNPKEQLSNKFANSQFALKVQSKGEKLEYFNQINFCLSRKKYFFYKFNFPLNLKIKILFTNSQFTFKLAKKYLKEEISNSKPRNLFYKYKTSKDNFLNFANSFLIKNFPEIFLEKYSNLERIYRNILWPKNPNFIVTTHAQFYDEIFKIYTAKNVLRGSKFLIVQHGGNYGIEKTFISYDIEKRICDRFLTWGWKDGNKTFPLFMPTLLNEKRTNKILLKKRKLLLVLYEFNLLPGKLAMNPRTAKKRNSYIFSMVKFLENLDKNILKNVNINYKPKDRAEVEKKSILHKFPKIKFIISNWDSKSYSYQVRNKFCLQIETVLSTGFVEAMYLNRPVILLYNQNILIGPPKKDFLYYIEILRKENVCFFNFNDAAKFINKTYNNLDLWWNSKNLQKVRKLFCDKYCKHSDNPIRDFKKSLIFNE